MRGEYYLAIHIVRRIHRMILGRHARVVDQVMDVKFVGLKILSKLVNTSVLAHIQGNGFMLICILENFFQFGSCGWVSASGQDSKSLVAKDLDKTQSDSSKINQSEASIEVM